MRGCGPLTTTLFTVSDEVFVKSAYEKSVISPKALVPRTDKPQQDPDRVVQKTLENIMMISLTPAGRAKGPRAGSFAQTLFSDRQTGAYLYSFTFED